MNPFARLETLGKRIRGWLPTEPAEAGPRRTPGPWWWLPAWSMGAFVAEAGVLNMIVPLGTLGLPLFLANMWLCFAVGGVAGHWTGRRRGYQPSRPTGRGWGQWRPKWWVPLLGAGELGIGVAYFSVGDWDYVTTNCLTGNACTFFQVAPVLFLVLGGISFVILGVIEALYRANEGSWRTDAESEA